MLLLSVKYFMRQLIRLATLLSTMAEKDHSCAHLKLCEARMRRTKLGCEARMRSVKIRRSKSVYPSFVICILASFFACGPMVLGVTEPFKWTLGLTVNALASGVEVLIVHLSLTH